MVLAGCLSRCSPGGLRDDGGVLEFKSERGLLLACAMAGKFWWSKALKLLRAFTVSLVDNVLRLFKLPYSRLALASHASAKGGC